MWFAIQLVLFPFFVAWKGFALAVLWGWFVVPFGVPQISAFHAVGLVVLGSLAFKDAHASNFKDEFRNVDPKLLSIVASILGPLAAIAFGWLAKAAMAAGW